MSILSKKIEDYNDLVKKGKQADVSKESVKKALDTHNELKSALADQIKKKSKPKVFQVQMPNEVKKNKDNKRMQTPYSIFNSSTVVENLEDIGVTAASINRKSTDDKEIDFKSGNNGLHTVKLKFVDNSNLYQVEEDNVLKLNPLQTTFSENELNEYTFQNPMLDNYRKSFGSESF